jgi:hypothetical protein
MPCGIPYAAALTRGWLSGHFARPAARRGLDPFESSSLLFWALATTRDNKGSSGSAVACSLTSPVDAGTASERDVHAHYWFGNSLHAPIAARNNAGNERSGRFIAHVRSVGQHTHAHWRNHCLLRQAHACAPCHRSLLHRVQGHGAPAEMVRDRTCRSYRSHGGYGSYGQARRGGI